MALTSSFVIVDADWTCKQAHDVLALEVVYAVVHRRDTDAVYAFKRDELISALGGDHDQHVREALRLDEVTPTPTAYKDGVSPDERSVILDRGRVASVFLPDRGWGLESYTPRGFAAPGTDQRDFTARVPSRIEVGKKATLRVAIGAVGAHVTGAATIEAARGATIVIEVAASGAIAIDEPSQQTVTTDKKDEIVTEFCVEGRLAGTGRIFVWAREGSRQVAEISATVSVAAGEPPPSRPVERSSRIQYGDQHPPDLEMQLIEDRVQHRYLVKLTGAEAALGLNHRTFGPLPFDPNIETQLTTFYSAIENIVRSTASAQQRYDDLAHEGAHLFKQVVRDQALRDTLWSIRDRIRTIRIQSEEPWVPWELCRLSGPDGNGGTATDKFIAERYAVTRWFLGVPEVRTLSIKDIGLIVPNVGGAATAAGERGEVERLAVDGRTVTAIPCQRREITKELAAAKYDVLHFVGHGAYQEGDADRSSLKLEDGSRFTPVHLSGEPENLGKRKPIVILNACEVGRSGKALNGNGGWPWAFVSAGAAAFIAPLWKAAESSAAQFSSELYAALLDGKSLGEAVVHAREQVRAADDPTWLAYTAFGHPDARIDP